MLCGNVFVDHESGRCRLFGHVRKAAGEHVARTWKQTWYVFAPMAAKGDWSFFEVRLFG